MKVVTRVYQRLREALYHQCELEAGKLKGEIELDEAYFGGRRKGKRGRGAAGKSIVFGLLERDGRVYTRIVECVTAEELMKHIRSKTRKGSVYYTDAYRGYRSLQRYGKHLTVNHAVWWGNAPGIILMGLKDSGVMRNIFCIITVASRSIISRCI